jgi:2-(1,2-epoxy-1,2-dihydrophenyl)acetyl-CoA isomerase
MSAATSVLFEVQGGVARIVLNRPAQMNALDLGVAKGLLAAARHCAADASVRAVILTGAGERAFCAGGDVAGFAANLPQITAFATELIDQLHLALSCIWRLGTPVVAAVNGVAAGAGLGLVGVADVVIAAEHAKFTSAYTGIGVTPDGGTTYHLNRILGPRRSAELMLTNRVLTAAEALDWGLVNRLVPGAELEAQAASLAASLARGPPLAHAGIKAMLRAGLDDQFEAHLQREAASIVRLMAGADGHEGIRAFTEKRRPAFRGA